MIAQGRVSATEPAFWNVAVAVQTTVLAFSRGNVEHLRQVLDTTGEAYAATFEFEMNGRRIAVEISDRGEA